MFELTIPDLYRFANPAKHIFYGNFDIYNLTTSGRTYESWSQIRLWLNLILNLYYWNIFWTSVLFQDYLCHLPTCAWKNLNWPHEYRHIFFTSKKKPVCYWWLVEYSLFCPKVLGRWRGPRNDILSVCRYPTSHLVKISLPNILFLHSSRIFFNRDFWKLITR